MSVADGRCKHGKAFLIFPDHLQCRFYENSFLDPSGNVFVTDVTSSRFSYLPLIKKIISRRLAIIPCLKITLGEFFNNDDDIVEDFSGRLNQISLLMKVISHPTKERSQKENFSHKAGGKTLLCAMLSLGGAHFSPSRSRVGGLGLYESG